MPSRVPLRRDTAVSGAQSTATSESSIWLNLPRVLPQFDLCKSAMRLLKDGAFQPIESRAEVSCSVLCGFSLIRTSDNLVDVGGLTARLSERLIKAGIFMGAV